MNRPIAFFIPTMDGGGAERVVINLLKGMVAHNLPLDLLLANAEGPYLNLIPKQVRTIDLAADRVIKAIAPLVRYLRTAKPKVIISHLNHANVIALVAKQLAFSNTKIIVVEHNTFSVAQSSLFRGHFVPPLMKLLYPKADAIVGVSQAVARDLEQGLGLAKETVKTIYNPVVDRELLAKKNNYIEHPWFQSQTIPVILAVGRLTEQKDFPTLLRAFALLRQKIPARLLILGEGELREELEMMVKQLGITEAVTLPGFVPNPQDYMSNASVFVLSSRWEGLPTALIEAMACGCPVVATDCPSGPKEILAEGPRYSATSVINARGCDLNLFQVPESPAWGFPRRRGLVRRRSLLGLRKYGELVPVGDVEALSVALVRTLQHPPQRELLVARAKDFEIENSVSDYLNLIEDICQ